MIHFCNNLICLEKRNEAMYKNNTGFSTSTIEAKKKTNQNKNKQTKNKSTGPTRKKSKFPAALSPQ